ncbi:hypothetical protein HK098_005333 [Nowakowskiella sp. JEL0407]|nr:hypothetical protein HK098_005333 [Nowakowskiella sp. JEL0407]
MLYLSIHFISISSDKVPMLRPFKNLKTFFLMERSYNDHLPTIIKEIGVNFVSLKTLMLLDLTYNDEVLRSFSLLFRNLQNLKVFAIKFVSPKPDSDAEISDASVKIFGSELSYLCGLESFSYYYYSQPTINLSVEMVYALAEIRSLKAVIFDCLTAFEDELITAIRSLLSKRRLETLKICTAFTPLPVLDAIKSCESLKIVETRASCSDVIPFLCSTSIHPLPKQLILDWSHTIYNMNLMSPVHFYGLESLTVRLNESEMSIHILNELMKCESLRKLHCLIITSEFEFENYPVMDTISQLVSESKSLRCVEVAGGEFDIGDKEFRFFINVVSSADTLRAVKFWVPETVRSAAQQSIENLLVTNKCLEHV